MSTSPKRQPTPFGKYLLLDRVNIGGMAEVWRAKTFGAGGFERLVAIKRILPNIAEDEEFISMFIDEAKITVQLNHANIAQIYELSHISNSYFIAMEYVSGRDMRALFDRCRKKGEPAPVPLVCYAMAKCCEGLDYAHRNKDRQGRDMNIVHRDVSPQNLLLSFDGEIKVIDFGIAKAAGKATKTQAGILKGKFGYMSPEQIRGLPLDRRSDIFAIGVCLYEMLTGERLFVGESDFSVLEKVRKVEVLPPSHFNRKIPEPLERIVMKALAKDVDDRYQYASEVADDLQRFLVTSDNVFGRKDLAAFMKATFAEDYDKEKQRLQEYHDVKAPEGMAAAAEAGFGAAPAPASQPSNDLEPQSPSAITAVPSSPAQVVAPSGPPKVSAPGGIPPARVTVPIPQRSSSPVIAPVGGASIPKLTAVAATKTTDKPEHAATQLDYSGDSGADSGPMPAPSRPTDPGLLPVQPPPTAPPPSGRPIAVAPLGSPTGEHEVSSFSSEEATVMGDPAMVLAAAGRPELSSVPVPLVTPSEPHLPVSPSSLPPAPKRPSGVRPMPSVANAPSPSVVPSVPKPAAPRPAKPVQNAQQPRGGGGVNKVLVGVVALLATVLIIVLAVELRPDPKGILYLNLPAELGGKADVSIGDVPLTEKDGSRIKQWPITRKVRAGKVSVLIVAPGYKNLVQTVEVREGNDFTEVGDKLEKQK